MKKLLFLSILSVLMIGMAWGQTNVFTDDFSTNQSATWTTSGQIGSSSFSVNRSGVDWGARRNTTGILELTNDASGSNNVNGWVYAYTSTTDFSSPYNTALSSNAGPVTWYFNIRVNRSNLAGFASSNYGLAFILAGSTNGPFNSGSGYALVLGNSSTPDPFRLAKYNVGLSGTLTNIITGSDNIAQNYYSIKVTYDPSNDQWELFVRSDGASAFADPMSGTLTSQGTAIDNTYTSISLGYMGGYWAGSTSANQIAFFDNITVQATEIAAGDPTITVTGTPLENFGGVLVGDNSDSQSYFVSGTDLTDDITITAPAGFEISLNESDWDVSYVLTRVGGEVEETEVFVRFVPDNPGIASGNISHESDEAVTVNVSVSGTGLKGDPSNHVSGFSAQTVNPNYSSIQLSWVDSIGDTTPDGYLIKGSDIGYASINAPVDGVAEVDAALIKNVIPSVQSHTFSALSGSTTYFFKVFPYTNSGSNINYLTSGSIPSVSATTDARPWVEDFETGTKTGYPSATVTMNGYDWNMTQALIGTDATGDIKLGSKAARLRYDSTTSTYGSITLLTPKADGIGSVSFYYARSNFSNDRTGISPSFVVEYSADMAAWTQIGDVVSLAGVDALTQFSEEVNITGSNHIRIRQISGDNAKRWNVDNIHITDFVQTFDYPAGTPVEEQGVTVVVTGGSANAGTMEIPSVTNGSFTPIASFVFVLDNTVPEYTITIQTTAAWGAYYLNGSWHAVAGNGTQIVFVISFDGKGDVEVPIILGDKDPTLPVTLSSFTASMSAQNFVNLMWVTQTETNVNGYYLHRADVSDLNASIMISPLIRAANTSTSQTYFFTDREIYQEGMYFYWLQSEDFDGSIAYHGPVSINVTLGDNNNNTPTIPLVTELNSVFPNPFNPTAFISYSIAAPADVKINIYNSRGQLVRSMNANGNVGRHRIEWNGTDNSGNSCSTGIYYIRMQAGKDSFIRKAMLMK